MKQTQGLIVTCLENRNLSFLDLEARNLENTSALVHRLEDYGSEFPCHWLLSAAASDSSQCQLVLKVKFPDLFLSAAAVFLLQAWQGSDCSHHCSTSASSFP